MHSCVTSKNAKWCHLIWPTLYIGANFVQQSYLYSIDLQIVTVFLGLKPVRNLTISEVIFGRRTWCK